MTDQIKLTQVSSEVSVESSAKQLENNKKISKKLFNSIEIVKQPSNAKFESTWSSFVDKIYQYLPDVSTYLTQESHNKESESTWSSLADKMYQYLPDVSKSLTETINGLTSEDARSSFKKYLQKGYNFVTDRRLSPEKCLQLAGFMVSVMNMIEPVATLPIDSANQTMECFLPVGTASPTQSPLMIECRPNPTPTESSQPMQSSPSRANFWIGVIGIPAAGLSYGVGLALCAWKYRGRKEKTRATSNKKTEEV